MSEEKKALAVFGDEQIAIRVDDDGFLTRTRRTVRLTMGTELYAATRSPGPGDKVAPFQPGYMKIVAAMGGQLSCPPVMRDPETGERRANPIVECYPGTATIKTVKATGVCAVRNPLTGQWVVSVQTILYDAEHVLRQALLKLASREDAVRIVSEKGLAKIEDLDGWSVIPLTPPFAYIACNFANQAVREAFQTFANLSATARQRTCSKAERLACDHNPITRMTWDYGLLDHPDNGAPGFVDVPLVAWVEHTGRDEFERMVERLATRAPGESDDVIDLVVGAPQEDDVPMIEEAAPDLDELTTDNPREAVRLPAVNQSAANAATRVDRGFDGSQLTKETTPATTSDEPPVAPDEDDVPPPASSGGSSHGEQAETSEPEGATTSEPEPEQKPSARKAAALRRCRAFEEELDEAVVRRVREAVGCMSPALADVDLLKTYRRALSAAMDGE